MKSKERMEAKVGRRRALGGGPGRDGAERCVVWRAGGSSGGRCQGAVDLYIILGTIDEAQLIL